MQHYLFSAIDSWFFREARSMDGSGATALESVFPPNNQTLLGALRTQIGAQYFNKNGGNWQEFSPDSSLASIIGYRQDYGNLKTQGAWLYCSKNKELYFPAPLNLVRRGDAAAYDFFKLSATATESDLGLVRLAELQTRPDQNRDIVLENYWISASDYTEVLAGRTPQQLQPLSKIICSDVRLGICRDNQTRRNEDGMLYQTRHKRLKPDWHLYYALDGIADDNTIQESLVRFGGEARMAAISPLTAAPSLPQAPKAEAGQLLILYLLTPMPDWRQEATLPPLPAAGFCRQRQGAYDVWNGEIGGIKVNIMSAQMGKPQRIGGWDLVKHQSLPQQSYWPAGSVWYIQTQQPEETDALIKALHWNYLTQGAERALGYGQVAVGLAPTF